METWIVEIQARGPVDWDAARIPADSVIAAQGHGERNCFLLNVTESQVLALRLDPSVEYVTYADKFPTWYPDDNGGGAFIKGPHEWVYRERNPLLDSGQA